MFDFILVCEITLILLDYCFTLEFIILSNFIEVFVKFYALSVPLSKVSNYVEKNS